MYANKFMVTPITGTQMPQIKEDNGRELVARKNGMEYSELLEWKHTRTIPGMPEGNTTGLFYQIEASSNVCKCVMMSWIMPSFPFLTRYLKTKMCCPY